MSTKTLAAFAGDLLEMTVDRVRPSKLRGPDPVFCALCTRVEGPFTWRPFGKDDALVRICLSCDGVQIPQEVDEPEEAPAAITVRVDDELVTPIERRLEIGSRRVALRKANRCINGPLEDRPGKRYGVVHGPVVRGGKCQHCIDVHGGKR